MLITVAICTLDHAESLRRTLELLTVMRLPDDLDWEVLVVNNNCSDHTDEVIKAFADRLPIRREFEPQRGLSRARNRAVDAAKGDYIVAPHLVF
jgi:glycosyltransferase involved in cell wall biosynthesis